MAMCRLLMALTLCQIWNIESVKGLSCVQCSTILDLFREKCKSGDFSPDPCPQNATRCIKYEGTHENIDFVFRDCASEEIETGCRHHRIANDMEIEMCFYACSRDGCNHGKISDVSLLKTVITVALIYVFVNSR